MRTLDDCVSIITGATAGIGRVTAELFAREGARVLAVGRAEDRGETLVEELGSTQCAFVQGDVADVDTCTRAVERAIKQWGRLDVLVNNAGIDHTAPLLDADLQDVRHVMDVNFFGPLQMLQAAGRAMSAGDGGSIVNVSSRLASIGVPTMGCYGATKGALEALTRHAAVELAPSNIRVNAVAPGFVRTAIFTEWVAEADDPQTREVASTRGIPQGRIAEPEEVAAAIAFLCRRDTAHITGVTLAVDGGYTAA